MRIYTRTGDGGRTGLIGGRRVPKSDARVEAYGAVDEANSSIGFALALLKGPRMKDLRALLDGIQADLFEVGALLAAGPGAPPRAGVPAGRAAGLEKEIDRLEATLQPLRQFIMPGGSPAGAALHAARTIVRRAERRAVGLGASAEVIVYLNRLSDLLFVAARAVNKRLKAPETAWKARL